MVDRENNEDRSARSPVGLISHYLDRWCIMPIFCRVTGSEARSRRTAIVVPGKNSNLPGSNGGEEKRRRERRREKEVAWRVAEKEEKGHGGGRRALVWGSRRLIHVSKWDRLLSLSYHRPSFSILPRSSILLFLSNVSPLFASSVSRSSSLHIRILSNAFGTLSCVTKLRKNWRTSGWIKIFEVPVNRW